MYYWLASKTFEIYMSQFFFFLFVNSFHHPLQCSDNQFVLAPQKSYGRNWLIISRIVVNTLAQSFRQWCKCKKISSGAVYWLASAILKIYKSQLLQEFRHYCFAWPVQHEGRIKVCLGRSSEDSIYGPYLVSRLTHLCNVAVMIH